VWTDLPKGASVGCRMADLVYHEAVDSVYAALLSGMSGSVDLFWSELSSEAQCTLPLVPLQSVHADHADPAAGLMTVCGLDGDHLEFALCGSDTIATLQERVADAWALFPGQVSIMAEGVPKTLAEDTTLADAGTCNFQAVRCAHGALQCVESALEGAVVCRDIRKGTVRQEFCGHTAGVNCVAADFVKNIALSGSDDASLCMWNMQDGQLLLTCNHEDAVICLRVCFVTMQALTGTDNGILCLWDLNLGEIVLECKPIRQHGNVASLCCMDVNFERMLAISGTADDKMRLWNLETRECIHTFNEHRNYVQAVQADFDIMRAVSGSSDSTLRYWDLEARTCLLTMEGHTDEVSALSVDFASEQALSCGDDSLMILWDLKSGVQLQVFRGHEARLVSVVADFSQSLALTAARDETTKLWDLATGECIRSNTTNTALTSLAVMF